MLKSEKSSERDGEGNYSKLVQRICVAYRASNQNKAKDHSVLWEMFFHKNKPIHDAIMSGEHVGAFDSPAESNLFMGFDDMILDFTISVKNNLNLQIERAEMIKKLIAVLAEAVGVKRVWNPEGGALFPYKDKPPTASIEDLLDAISDKIGLNLDFPNPFPDEFGLATSRGIASYRAVHAIYQAWRLKILSDQYGPRVLEVGAGLGRTAYYAHRLGVKTYTIIDLPFTNLSQANFLGRILSPVQVSLFGEPHMEDSIRILPIGEMQAFEDFDVFANVDSLTEMGNVTSSEYVSEFATRGKVLWSVNHEANQETVASLSLKKMRSIGRFPYWLRPGYLEEIFLIA